MMRNTAVPIYPKSRTPHLWQALALFACLAVLCALLPMAALAATETQDGLQAELTTDKPTYALGEMMNMKVALSNTNTTNLANVQVEVTLPTGLTLVSGETSTTFPVFTAGEAGEVFLSAKVEIEPEQNTSFFPLLLWVGLGLILAAVLVVVLVRRNNQKKKSNQKNGGNGPKSGGDPRRDGSNSQRSAGDPRRDGANSPKSGAPRREGGNTQRSGGNAPGNSNDPKDGGTRPPQRPRTYSLLLCLLLALSILGPGAPSQAEPVRKSFYLTEMVTANGIGTSIMVQVSYDWEEAIPVTGVTLNLNTMPLVLGGSAGTLTATVSPADATDQSLSWISSNPAVATVLNGVVTPVSIGTTTITVTTADGGKQASCEVQVTASSVPVTGLTLSPGSLTLTQGGSSGTLVATVAPPNASNKNVSWTSSNPSVATVSGGVVSPVGTGTATITAVTADGGKQATSTVRVNASSVAVTGVSLSTNTLTLTQGGAIGSLTATVSPRNASNQSVTWASSNTAVATVSGGIVTPVGAGSATITVTTADGGKQATCSVRVNASSVAVTGVTVSPTVLSLTQGGATGTLTATVSPANATNKTVTWASNNTAVATVSGGGVVTPVGPGTATITVTTADGSKQAAAAATVTAAAVPVTGVSLDRTTIDGWDMDSTPTQSLTATVSPADATNKNVTWASSNTAVATVSGGVVTAVAPGSATITVATADGGKQAACTVTIIRGGKTAANAEAAKVTGFSADAQASNTGTTIGFPVQTSSALAQGATYQLVSTSVPLGGSMDAATGLLSLNTQNVVDAADLSTVTLTFTVTVNGTASDPATLPISALFGQDSTAAKLRAGKATVLALHNTNANPVSAGAASIPLNAQLSQGVSMPQCPASNNETTWPDGITAANLSALTADPNTGMSTVAIGITGGTLAAGTSGAFAFPGITLSCAGTAYVLPSTVVIAVPTVNP